MMKTDPDRPEEEMGIEERWQQDEQVRMARKRRRSRPGKRYSWRDELSNLSISRSRVLTSSKDRS
jgi:hypothetical protein